jgi:hypothetical protein
MRTIRQTSYQGLNHTQKYGAYLDGSGYGQVAGLLVWVLLGRGGGEALCATARAWGLLLLGTLVGLSVVRNTIVKVSKSQLKTHL